MTGVIFQDWIMDFNKRMKNNGRSVLLFMDNAPSHIVSDLTKTVEEKQERHRRDVKKRGKAV